MLAIAAAVLFIVALFDSTLGEVNLVTLGLVFVALHLALAGLWSGYSRTLAR